MIRRVLRLLEILRTDIENNASKEILLSTLELIREELLRGDK